jgi:hypothetical protein
MAAVEVGPQGVQEDHLGVRGLPEQEVRRALLPRRPQEQVHLGYLGVVQVLRDRLLVDLVRLEPARHHVPGDRRRRVGDLGLPAVVDAELQGEPLVVLRHLLGGLQFGDHALPQPPRAARPHHPHAEVDELIAAAADDVAVEAHQEAHLLG